MTPRPTREHHGPRFLVGNDVVDLSHPRCRDMPLDGRFVRRVCTDEERERLAGSPAPRRSLWLTWAAKEAAFKVISKRLGSPPPFVHARFVVTVEGETAGAPEGPAGDGPILHGRVAYQGASVAFREEPAPAPDVVHVVAWSPDGPPVIEAGVEPLPTTPPPLHHLTRRERSAVHSAPSGWVRLVARARAAAVLDLPERSLQIVCGEGPPGRTFPLLLVEGRTGSGWDVSLSHHGGWVACALGRSGGPGRGDPPP